MRVVRSIKQRSARGIDIACGMKQEYVCRGMHNIAYSWYCDMLVFVAYDVSVYAWVDVFSVLHGESSKRLATPRNTKKNVFSV